MPEKDPKYTLARQVEKRSGDMDSGLQV